MNLFKISATLMILLFTTAIYSMQAPTNRLFLALEIPATNNNGEKIDFNNVEQFISNRVGGWKSEPKHLTILFIGDIPQNAIETVKEAIKKAVNQFPPHSLNLSNVTVKGGVLLGNALGYELNENASLSALHSLLKAEIAAALDKKGISHKLMSGFPFKPHITLGRAGNVQQASSLASQLGAPVSMKNKPFTFKTLTLYSSQGGKYVPVMQWQL